MLHKIRDLLIKQRTMLINALRSHLAEFGVVSAQGPAGLQAAIVSLHEMQDQWPEPASAALHSIVDQLRDLARQIEKLQTRLQAWHRKDETSRRLAPIPGIGPITASAIVAAVPDASIFRSGRQFAAWLGLTPKSHSSGGKEKLGGISKQGDSYLRRLLVVGATSVIRVARKQTSSKLWGDEAARAQASSGRLGGTGEQDCAHRMGDADTRTGLRSSGACRGCVDEICLASTRKPRPVRRVMRFDDKPVRPGMGTTCRPSSASSATR